MISVLREVNAAVNGFVWGVPAMAVIIGAGLWLSFRTRFIQFSRIREVLRSTIGKVFSRQRAASGATLDIGFVWDVADTFNGLMVVPNLLAMFMLSGTLARIIRGNDD